MFSFSMNAIIASLICLQLERLGVFKWHLILVFLTLMAPTRAIKESRIRTNSLSQLSDDLTGLSLSQSMCVSVSKSAPLLDFQVRRSKHCRSNASGTAL